MKPSAAAIPDDASVATRSCLERLDRARRRARALGLASLFARAARECGGCEDLALSREVSNGLVTIEAEFIEELNSLL